MFPVVPRILCLIFIDSGESDLIAFSLDITHTGSKSIVCTRNVSIPVAQDPSRTIDSFLFISPSIASIFTPAHDEATWVFES